MSRLDDLVPLDAGQSPERRDRPALATEAALVRAILIVAAMTTAWKLLLVFTGNVIWEESHFAVLGRRPDLGYADVPAGWPLLANAFTSLFGWSPAAIRIPGLLIAQLIPLGVFFLAKAVVPRRDALWATLIAFVLPAIGTNGTIFYPEAGLQLCFALMLGCAVRGLRGRAPVLWWAGAGLAAAAGLLIHYRYAVAGVGLLAFVLATREGRRLWLSPGFWIAGLIALGLGLAPGLLYNMREGWPALGYHAVDRPQWGFDPGFFLRTLALQAAYATPPFFLASAVAAWRLHAAPDPARRLLVWAGAGVFLTFAALALFNRIVNAHWLFLTYVALLPFVPAMLRRFVQHAGPIDRRRLRWVVVLAPVLVVVGALGATAFQLAWRRPDLVPGSVRGFLLSDYEDWPRLKSALARAQAAARTRFGGEPLIATAGHLSALRLEFPGRAGRDVYAYVTPFDRTTRFDGMRRDWRLDEAALRALPGRAVVLALPEPSYLYHTPAEVDLRRRLCADVADIAFVERQELPPGREIMSFYTGRVRARPEPQARCALFPELYLAQPGPGEILDGGSFHGFGGVAHSSGVRRVEILLDGRPAAVARYGLDPAGARMPDVLRFDPNWPRVQFDYSLPLQGVASGPHRLSLRALTNDGRTLQGAERTIYVR